MMRTALASLVLLCPLSLAAAQCPGDPGFTLTAAGEVEIGNPYTLSMQTPEKSFVMLFGSFGTGPTTTQYGQLCIDLPAAFVYTALTDNSGFAALNCGVPCDTGLIGVTAYFQFLSVNAAKEVGVSNMTFLSVIDGDCAGFCEEGCKPQTITLCYTGSDCSATSHSQDPTKVICTGDPAHAATVRILVQDKAIPHHQKASIYFEGQVNLDTAFVASSLNGGRSRFKGDTHVFVYDLNDNLLQHLMFHTSCSQPLGPGDQFGSMLLLGLSCEP